MVTNASGALTYAEWQAAIFRCDMRYAMRYVAQRCIVTGRVTPLMLKLSAVSQLVACMLRGMTRELMARQFMPGALD